MAKRFTISVAGSTSSSGTAVRSSVLSRNMPRSAPPEAMSRLTSAVYRLNTSHCLVRVECCSRNTVSGLNRCSSPSRR
ncbi:MAG: hypothetical protein K0S40_3543 [Actinomycetospora sp.]|nr:hypothetical protein [Actinomycetospora sp.]